MDTNFPKYVLALALFATIGVGAFALGTAYSPSEQSTAQPALYKGMVHIQQLRDGKVVFEETNHNILLLNGTNTTTSQLFGAPSAAGATEIENITLGNGTTAGPSDSMSSTDLAGITTAGCSGLGPSNALVWINIPNSTAGYIDGSGNVSANHLWTSACGSGTGIEVNRTAISSTTGSFFAANQFTNVFLQSGDQLNVTWYVWVR